MRALVQTRYGSPDALSIEEIAQPVIGDDDVLIGVRAASINAWDWDNLTGAWQARPFSGVVRPKRAVPGADVAGRVEEVGRNVVRFERGDAVFGDLCVCGWGSLAEYACASDAALAPKPAGVSFEQAAAIPQAGVMALQGIRDYGQVQDGHQVLINGAAGGVGTFAIQMAKGRGAEVTAVDRGEKRDTMIAVGADHVVDYTREDFSRSGRRYDLVLDVAAHRSMFDYRRVLSPRGRYVLIGGANGRIAQALLLGGWHRVTRSARRMGILAHRPNHDLALLGAEVDRGHIAPVIDRCYSLEEAPEAFRYFGTGKVRGKIVVTV